MIHEFSFTGIRLKGTPSEDPAWVKQIYPNQYQCPGKNDYNFFCKFGNTWEYLKELEFWKI